MDMKHIPKALLEALVEAALDQPHPSRTLQEALQKALEVGADMVVVHHGMFWNRVNPSCVGYTGERISFLHEHKRNFTKCKKRSNNLHKC